MPIGIRIDKTKTPLKSGVLKLTLLLH